MCEKDLREIGGVSVRCDSFHEEIHPFNNPSDIDNKTEYLFVGTFPPYRFVTKELKSNDVDWFYGSQDNSFWDLFMDLNNDFKCMSNERREKCRDKKIAFIDLFQKIRRYQDLSSDEDISPIAIVDISYYLERNKNIKAIFFTSLWAEKIAKKEYLKTNRDALKANSCKTDYVEGSVFKVFKNLVLEREVRFYTLPSPSPSNMDIYESKKLKWRDIFKEAGLIQ